MHLYWERGREGGRVGGRIQQPADISKSGMLLKWNLHILRYPLMARHPTIKLCLLVLQFC